METTFEGRPDSSNRSVPVSQRVCVLRIPRKDQLSDHQHYGFAIRGPWITSVSPGSPAWDAGMRDGQRILYVEGESVKEDGTKQLLARIRRQGRNKVTLLVEEPSMTDIIIDTDSFPGDTNDHGNAESRFIGRDLYGPGPNTLDRKSLPPNFNTPNGSAQALSRSNSMGKRPPNYGFNPNVLPPVQGDLLSQRSKTQEQPYTFTSMPTPQHVPMNDGGKNSEPVFTSTPRPCDPDGEVYVNKDAVVTTASNARAQMRINLRHHPEPPETYVMFTALVTALCCPILGGFGLYRALAAKRNYEEGRWKAGENNRNKALLIGVVALVIGIAVWAMTFCVVWVRSIWTEGI